MRSWWNKTIVSRIIRHGCRHPDLMASREHILPLATGDLFELGCGDGINLPLLDRGSIRSYSAVDPADELLELAREVAAGQPYRCELRTGVGEDIPFASSSFDTVMTTFTMCSVKEPERVMKELRRILRPGGTILFLEHGLAPDPALQKWQRRIDPISTRLLGNCHMSRQVSGSFRNAGFETECLGGEFARDLPRYTGWIEWGRARA